jgi:hypothetical protein
MATHTGTSGQTQGMSGTSGNMRMGSRQGMVSDDTYNMVSVLYHTLQGCETYQKYLDDAQSAGNQEIKQFLQETVQELQRRAQRGQRLLMQCLQQEGGGQQMHSQGGAQGQHMAGGSQGSQMRGGQQGGQSGLSGSQQHGSASGAQRSSGSSNLDQGSEPGGSPRGKSSR